MPAGWLGQQLSQEGGLPDLCQNPSNLSGEAGIRTLGRFDPTPVFKTGAFGHSATSPETRQPLPAGNLTHRAGKKQEYSGGPKWLMFFTPTGSGLRRNVSV